MKRREITHFTIELVILDSCKRWKREGEKSLVIITGVSEEVVDVCTAFDLFMVVVLLVLCGVLEEHLSF